jgi:hypothetical protein
MRRQGSSHIIVAMRGYFTSKRWTVWMACFAILLNALAPTLSHAMTASARAPATWEICRAPGSTSHLARLDGVQQLLAVGKFNQEFTPALAVKAGDHHSMAMADCAYCLPHAAHLAILPTAIAAVPRLDGGAVRPYLFYHAPTPLLALSAAPPRGPPAAS